MNTLSNQYLEASNKLMTDGYYRQCVNLSWIALRHEIFKWLENKHITYESTREALLKIICYFANNDISTYIYMLNTTATLSEWDKDFEVDAKTAEYFYVKCNDIIKELSLQDTDTQKHTNK